MSSIIYHTPSCLNSGVTNISTFQRTYSSVGYLLGSMIVSPLAMCYSLYLAPVYTVKYLWKSYQLQQLKHESASKKDYPLKARVAKFEHQKRKYSKRAVVALLQMIPLVGIPAAAAYLKAKNPSISETGVLGGVEALVQHYGKFGKQNILNYLYPFRGISLADSLQDPLLQYHQEFVERLKGISHKTYSFEIDRGDGKKHEVNWVHLPSPLQNIQDEIPIMVIFHGNRSTAAHMIDYAKHYQKLGYHVCMLTMGGYPGSDENLPTNEATSYQDANGMIEHLKGLGFERIGVHGRSLGGTLAFAAAELHPEHVKVVVADQTMNKAADVFGNSSKKIPCYIARGLVRAGIPAGKIIKNVFIGEGSNFRPYTTDSCDNIRKAKVLAERAKAGKPAAEVIALGTLRDRLMSYGKMTEKGSEANCSQDIMQARYGDGSCVYMYAGEHCSKELTENFIEDIKPSLLKYLPIKA